ncbi:hypothetical protein M440DRAFT_1231088 [Trichoderma longibrachiatum ATCC 18648]|uniref:Uncharacterized protein n=1 Tax=Trichoderma longibrachiatum ATCC 18648 TaxID=983965 RepID=A0A2T4C4Z8_TRILO|nr:hypothetical protein M440DRAFT_1231088 [Trichoderma longibrachiatum ATCC 18648]
MIHADEPGPSSMLYIAAIVLAQVDGELHTLAGGVVVTSSPSHPDSLRSHALLDDMLAKPCNPIKQIIISLLHQTPTETRLNRRPSYTSRQKKRGRLPLFLFPSSSSSPPCPVHSTPCPATSSARVLNPHPCIRSKLETPPSAPRLQPFAFILFSARSIENTIPPASCSSIFNYTRLSASLCNFVCFTLVLFYMYLPVLMLQMYHHHHTHTPPSDLFRRHLCSPLSSCSLSLAS